MTRKTEQFFRKMLQFFPTTVTEYEAKKAKRGKVLETVVIEDLFMPEIIKLLEKNENVNLLSDIFNYFEEVSNCDDEYLLNIFSITALEVLGNDRQLLKIAQKYMGPKTTLLQIEADRDLGRI